MTGQYIGTLSLEQICRYPTGWRDLPDYIGVAPRTVQTRGRELDDVPVDRLVIESDAGAQYIQEITMYCREHHLEHAAVSKAYYVDWVVDHLAEIRRVPTLSMIRILSHNALRLFRVRAIR